MCILHPNIYINIYSIFPKFLEPDINVYASREIALNNSETRVNGRVLNFLSVDGTASMCVPRGFSPKKGQPKRKFSFWTFRAATLPPGTSMKAAPRRTKSRSPGSAASEVRDEHIAAIKIGNKIGRKKGRFNLPFINNDARS